MTWIPKEIHFAKKASNLKSRIHVCKTNEGIVSTPLIATGHWVAHLNFVMECIVKSQYWTMSVLETKSKQQIDLQIINGDSRQFSCLGILNVLSDVRTKDRWKKPFEAHFEQQNSMFVI